MELAIELDTLPPGALRLLAKKHRDYTTATLWNWETSKTPIPKAVELALEALERRLAA